MTMFENADLEIIRFRAEDIIATSADEDEDDTGREGDTGSEGDTGDRQPEPEPDPVPVPV